MYASIDDLLGNSDERFFGSGYRRVKYSWGGLTEPEQTEFLKSRAAVTYPKDWSRKNDIDQKPHLSTIDAIILGIKATKQLMLQSSEVTHDEYRLCKIDVKAGTVSSEISDDIEITCFNPDYDKSRTHENKELNYRATVGNLTVTMKYIRDLYCSQSNEEESHRYWGSGFHKVAVQLRQLETDNAKAKAIMHVIPDDDRRSDFHDRNMPISIIDVFVAALQLGQVLVYNIDHISRADSNTMWMRNTSIITTNTAYDTGDGLPISVSVEKATILSQKGKFWRTARIRAQVGNTDLCCDVAHQLPKVTS
jgi:hypothetical protein